MQKVFQVFEQINNTNSVVDKENILRANKDSSELQTLLKYNLDPKILMQFNKMPCSFTGQVIDPTTAHEKTRYDFFIGLVEDLAARLTTGNKAKETVESVFKLFTEEEFKWYSKILLKEPIGVGNKTVNKVWPKLVTEFKLMLAPSELPVVTQLMYPRYIQPKLDGYRCIFKRGIMLSRTGKPFGNKNLPKYFKSLTNIENTVLDGELYADGGDFNTLQTVLNTYDAPLPNTLKYIVYDAVPYVDWVAEKCSIPYSERLKELRGLLNDVIADYKKVIDISNDLVNTSGEAIQFYKQYLKDGKEGAMLKDPDGLYKWKRVTIKSGEMLKLKPFKSVDLPIESIYDGEGKYEGMAGGVVVSFNGVAVRVGSGFNDAMRKEMAERSSDFIGKTIEVKYFEETEDGSLRHPTFERFREEKD